MTSVKQAKEAVCSSLLRRIGAYEQMMQNTEDVKQLIQLHKTKTEVLQRLELVCR